MFAKLSILHTNSVLEQQLDIYPKDTDFKLYQEFHERNFKKEGHISIQGKL